MALENLTATGNARKKTMMTRRSTAFALLALLCFGALYAAVFAAGIKKSESAETSLLNVRELYAQTADTYAVTGSDVFKTPSRIFSYERLAQMSDGRLLLINGNNAAPDVVPGELVNIADYVWTLDKNLTGNIEAATMLKRLFDSAADAGYGKFRATDFYRSHELQRDLYDNAADKSFVSPPGHSEHQIGLAADISYDGVNIGNSEQGAWIAKNAHRFGFVLRYPPHKTEITGIPFEPWHFRYVGLPHARIMYENDLVLEEYIDYLKQNEEKAFLFDGVRYAVSYLSDCGASIVIPADHIFSASLDNTGGIIVTAWIGAVE